MTKEKLFNAIRKAKKVDKIVFKALYKEKLKTLKDILPCVMKTKKCYPTTLKGNPTKIVCSNCSAKFKTKEEAIKWVKTRKCQTRLRGERCDDCDAIDFWIKHFFNITEEDLK